jgi:Reverse transcriptase (RNA-dependent DNA polymerase)
LVCKLNKGIYGLKQSGRVWHNTLRSELEKIGFKNGEADKTVFFRFREGRDVEIVGWYVDNGLMASNSTLSMDRMIQDVRGSFDIQDMGDPTRLLGIWIIRNRELGTIHISQSSFIDTIAKHFEITCGRAVNSPMDPNIELHISTNPYDITDLSYASLIGSINYCAVATRPDVSYAVNKCAQYTSKPNITHWEVAKRIVRYLINMREYGITYQRDGDGVRGFAHNLAGFTDADFTGDKDDRKSMTGWIFTYNGGPISWASRKQKLVSQSTMEAELIAGSFATAEGIWLIRLGSDFKHDLTPIPIFTDNQSSIAFSNDSLNNSHTKHIDVHYHYTKEQINSGNIDLQFIPSFENPADVLTKPLTARKHLRMLSILGIRRA